MSIFFYVENNNLEENYKTVYQKMIHLDYFSYI